MSRVARIDRVQPQPAVLFGRPHRDAGAAVAALLSFVVPGLGQAYNRQMVLAWLLALPVLILAAGAALLFVLPDVDVLSHLLDIRFLVALIVLDVALLGWRAIAIVQAFAARRVSRERSAATYVTAGLVLIAIVMHAVPAIYAAKAIDTLNAVALGGEDAASSDRREPRFGRNVLLRDRAPSRMCVRRRARHLPAGRRRLRVRSRRAADRHDARGEHRPGRDSAMISVPRDLYGVPLPDGTPTTRSSTSDVLRGHGPRGFPRAAPRRSRR